VSDQQPLGVDVPSLSTFGEDASGELYAASLSGTVYKIVPTAAATPTVSIGDKAMLEGDSRTRSMSFPVTLSQPASTTVTMQYTVAGVDATPGTKPGTGADFRTKSGTLTFTPNGAGRTPIVKLISLPVFGDTDIEGPESFAITLSGLTGGGYTLARDVGTGTILEDDDGVADTTLGIGDATIVSALSGSQRVSLPVTLSARPPTPVTVTYTVNPNTATYSAKATGGGDFGGKLTGTITFSTTATLRQLNIPIWPSLVVEPDATFTVTLSGAPPGITMLRSTGTVNILGDGS
jgi:hypothetical protein